MAFVDVVELTANVIFAGRVKAAMVVEAMELCTEPMDSTKESDQSYRQRVRFGMSVALAPEDRHNAMVWMVAARGVTAAATDAQIQTVVRAILLFLVKES